MFLKKVFITGVSRGLGQALAIKFSIENWFVSGISRSLPEESLRGKIQHCLLDLKNNQSIRNKIKDGFPDMRDLDLLILNAAVLPDIAYLKDTSLQSMKEVFDINLWANKELLDFFIKATNVKQVIAISSGASISGSSGWNSYAISKTALNMLIKMYARESDKTHFISLAPGLVKTFMQEKIRQASTDKFDVIGRIQEQYKLGLIKKSDDVAVDIFNKLDYFREFPSGSYLDIRTMKGEL